MHYLTLASLLPLALAAPVIQPRAAQLIPGSYIVKLKDGSSETTLLNTIKGIRPNHIYRNSKFRGFAADLSSSALKAVQDLPEVSTTAQTDTPSPS